MSTIRSIPAAHGPCSITEPPCPCAEAWFAPAKWRASRRAECDLISPVRHGQSSTRSVSVQMRGLDTARTCPRPSAFSPTWPRWRRSMVPSACLRCEPPESDGVDRGLSGKVHEPCRIMPAQDHRRTWTVFRSRR